MEGGLGEGGEGGGDGGDGGGDGNGGRGQSNLHTHQDAGPFFTLGHQIFLESQWRRERYRLAAFSQPFLSNL